MDDTNKIAVFPIFLTEKWQFKVLAPNGIVIESKKPYATEQLARDAAKEIKL